MTQQIELNFEGATYDADMDGPRLGQQLTAVRNAMLDYQWHTPEALADRVGTRSTASITARLRDLRKPDKGGFQIESRRKAGGGSWEYRIVPAEPNGVV